jgi:hypothetical protein
MRPLRPPRLALEVAARIGQGVEAFGAFRRRAARGIGAALTPALLVLLNHGRILHWIYAPEKRKAIKSLDLVRNS